MCILCAIRSEDATRRHWFTIDCFNDTHLVGADFDERNFAYDFFKRPLDQMQTWFQNVCLNANFAFSSNYASWRHLCAQVTSLLDGDLSCADIDENPSHN